MDSHKDFDSTETDQAYQQDQYNEEYEQQKQVGQYDFYGNKIYYGMQQQSQLETTEYEYMTDPYEASGQYEPEMAEFTVLSTKLAPTTLELEQVLTGEENPFDNLEYSNNFLNRLGAPLSKLTGPGMITVLGNQISDIVDLFHESFSLVDGKLVMSRDEVEFDVDVVASEKILLVKDINEVYFTAKLVALRFPNASVLKFKKDFDTLQSVFDDLLNTFTKRDEDEPLFNEDLSILISLGLLVSALAHFIGVEERARAEPALELLISLTPVKELILVFKDIFPPAHQSRLFTLSLYRDLQTVEAKLEPEEFDQIAKLKALMELAFLRYGDFFLRYYGDEVMRTLNRFDLMDCPSELWAKATYGGKDIQFDFGPSFLINMLKYQWGIIKDFNGIAPDPSNSSILYHTRLDNLFDFLFDQAQQLFIFVGALNELLADGETQLVNFNTDADTLITVYMEMMHHLERICIALNNSYAILPQETGTEDISRAEQMKMKQLSKVYILLITFSVCSIQLSLTGPLQITSAPSISAILEQYVSKSDFTTPIKECVVLDRFVEVFIGHSPDLIRNYSIIRGLSMPVFLHLEGKETKVTALNTGLSWNMFSFYILMSAVLLVQLLWVSKSIWLLAYDQFLV